MTPVQAGRRPTRRTYRWHSLGGLWLALLCLAALAACAPEVAPRGAAERPPALTASEYLTADNHAIPVQSWLPDGGAPRAVILAVHGFDDYANAFALPGRWFARHGIATYAYDQRGFGRAPDRGLWPGTAALVADFDTMARLLHARYPDAPLYVLGESMGSAVVMVALSRPDAPKVAGAILSAPAVRGRSALGPVGTAALWLLAHTVPGLELSGQSLNILPSDNLPMLRALGRDPLVIKETRVDALWGLTNLMDQALAAAPRLAEPLLVLYGEHDYLIPRQPIRMMLKRLPPDSTGRRRIAIYPKGYHMLLRDLEAETVWADIVSWIDHPQAPLPSGADRTGLEAIARN